MNFTSRARHSRSSSSEGREDVISLSDYRAVPAPKGAAAAFAAAVAIAILLRLPLIGSGLPYFYEEDEAHHFNRVVEMVQKGDFNPHYFHKPSLHFYLRMPFVALGFLSEVRAGHIRSIKEIQTRDRDGVAGYAFSASHPAIVKWNRAFSVLLSVGHVALTFLIALLLFNSTSAALTASLLVVFSPSLIQDSGKIGVDGLMTFMALLTSYLALLYMDRRGRGLLIAVSLCAGLTVSSKYNALPIVLVPMLALLFVRNSKEDDEKRFAAGNVGAVLLLPIAGFILGSPYILASIPLFLDQLAYEIWHYGIAGHVGHMADPGIAQFLFYSRWLTSEALGYLPVLAAVFGILSLSLHRTRMGIVLLSFPILFFILMVNQKANFTRNMLVVIPYAALAAAALVEAFSRLLPRAVVSVLVVGLVSQPAYAALRQLEAAPSETRRDLLKFLIAPGSAGETAIFGSLQPASELLSLPNISKVDDGSAPVNLALLGFDQLASHTNVDNLELIKKFNGELGDQRIVQNPEIFLYRLPKTELTDDSISEASALPLFSLPIGAAVDGGFLYSGKACPEHASPSEEYCWVQTRIALLSLPELIGADQVTIDLKAMSPLPGQTITTTDGETFAFKSSGDFETFELHLSKAKVNKDKGILLLLSKVQSNGADSRRLGIAIQQISQELETK